MIHEKRFDLVRDYKNAFPCGDDSMIGEYLTKDLFNRGFIEETSAGKLKLTAKFLGIYINKHTATEEIFALYPAYWDNNGNQISLTAFDRNIFANLYDKDIQSSAIEHMEIVKDIEYGKEHGLLNIGIEKFLKSKHWLSIRTKRLGQQVIDDRQTYKDNDF